MNVLLIYPENPPTFFSFKYALKFISKKAVEPPLGLLTVSALLPEYWRKKLIDLNVTNLDPEDIKWADLVFISAMIIQKDSVKDILGILKNYDTKIVAGGPLFTHEVENFPDIDHFVLNEAELTLPGFLEDIEHGRAGRIYETGDYAEMTATPVPDYHLLDINAYASMSIQVSRGCPFSCEFCEIPLIHGSRVRVKSREQVISELHTIFNTGWRGTVSIVDDNFIGRKEYIKNELLPSVITWMKQNDYPFIFNVQTSANIADDEELLSLMTQAGIRSTFIGIETLSEESLCLSKKYQNRNRDMTAEIRKIQEAGLQVSGGFIVGFDTDTPQVFGQITEFINKSGILWAMVGILNAPKNTRLYHRLKKEQRLTSEMTGNNTDYSLNFVPRMGLDLLMDGYNSIIQGIYSVRPYYDRIHRMFQNYRPVDFEQVKTDPCYLRGFLKSIYFLGIIDKGRKEYWKFLFWALLRKRYVLLEGMMFAMCGYHFRKVYGIS
ncbi:MAG TPA: B12-binding domain-containing radical SAM protein [Bacteroidales bacterium]|nr:B12-binding domain-containing radical SAM protein [Bacteroidales bacterium]HRW86708.1 B12-binding domain-containing radical SAM protein [Bacteroidales bacterium]